MHCSRDWGRYVRSRRREAKLTGQKLAKLAEIDPSYITIIERDGYVPRRQVVRRLARGLDRPEIEALLAAGFCPPIRPELLQRIMAVQPGPLDPQTLIAMRRMSGEEQRALAVVVRGLAAAVRAEGEPKP